MFYTDPPGPALRLGDVVQGYLSAVPSIKSPAVPAAIDFHIGVEFPAFAAVLSPCCSIGHGTILLVPLTELNPNFLLNPYWSEDFLRINEVMLPENSVPPQSLRAMPEEKRIEHLGRGPAYAFVEFFVFGPSETFPEYELRRKQTTITLRHRMIDFRRVFRVDCGQILSPENAPLETKLLQLSAESRRALRDKYSKYIERTPKEDEIGLVA